MRSVADADAQSLEVNARTLGESKRWLAPVAWGAGTIVLLVRGVKLLLLNWRLSLIQLVPAIWVWLAMWDLKVHALHGRHLAHLPFPARIALIIGVLLLSVAAFWCNATFAFALDAPGRPRIGPAFQRANDHRSTIIRAGLLVGSALAFAVVIVPRTGRLWLFSGVLSIVIGVMLISFVAIPARIIGVKPPKLTPRESVSRAAIGGTLSAVAMGPGFILDRIGLILLGLHHFHLLGFFLLSVGTALYAAGMASVKAVKLSMKLKPAEHEVTAGGATADPA